MVGVVCFDTNYKDCILYVQPAATKKKFTFVVFVFNIVPGLKRCEFVFQYSFRSFWIETIKSEVLKWQNCLRSLKDFNLDTARICHSTDVWFKVHLRLNVQMGRLSVLLTLVFRML